MCGCRCSKPRNLGRCREDSLSPRLPDDRGALIRMQLIVTSRSITGSFSTLSAALPRARLPPALRSPLWGPGGRKREALSVLIALLE